MIEKLLFPAAKLLQNDLRWIFNFLKLHTCTNSSLHKTHNVTFSFAGTFRHVSYWILKHQAFPLILSVLCRIKWLNVSHLIPFYHRKVTPIPNCRPELILKIDPWFKHFLVFLRWKGNLIYTRIWIYSVKIWFNINKQVRSLSLSLSLSLSFSLLFAVWALGGTAYCRIIEICRGQFLWFVNFSQVRGLLVGWAGVKESWFYLKRYIFLYKGYCKSCIIVSKF